MPLHRLSSVAALAALAVARPASAVTVVAGVVRSEPVVVAPAPIRKAVVVAPVVVAAPLVVTRPVVVGPAVVVRPARAAVVVTRGAVGVR